MESIKIQGLTPEARVILISAAMQSGIQPVHSRLVAELPANRFQPADNLNA